MDDDGVAEVDVGVGGDVGDHSARPVRRPRLPRGHGREDRRKAAARPVAARVARIVVPDGFLTAAARLRCAAAADDERG